LGGYKKYAHWYLQQIFNSNTSAFFKEKKLLGQNNFMDKWSWRNYAAALFPDKVATALQKKTIHQQNHQPFLNKDFLVKYQNADTLQKPVIKQLEDILYYNTFNVGLPELLRYADRNSMAHSREVRLPFLFHEMVEFIFSLPGFYKIRDGFTKWILRKSIQQYMPAEIIWQRGKIGFEPPQKQWMQNKVVQEKMINARERLVKENVLVPAILQTAIQPRSAHEANNYDWRYLCAAEMFNKYN